jgi:pyruvate dehydrogenase E1 component
MELGIAEMNLFIMLSAFGLSHRCSASGSCRSARSMIPSSNAALDALNYACYQDARFMLTATPSGITLAPEGGAHQSIATPLIGMAQDGLAFEPAFVDELAAILRFVRVHAARRQRRIRTRHLAARRDRRLGLSAPVDPHASNSRSASTMRMRQDIVNGAYWMRAGAQCAVVIAYTGAVAPEAIEAVGHDGRGPPRCRPARHHLGRPPACRLERRVSGPRKGGRMRCRHVERLLAGVPQSCGSSRSSTDTRRRSAWLGSVYGHRTRALGVEHFGQTGTIADLYRHHGIDAQSIMAAAQSVVPGRPLRHLRVA